MRTTAGIKAKNVRGRPPETLKRGRKAGVQVGKYFKVGEEIKFKSRKSTILNNWFDQKAKTTVYKLLRMGKKIEVPREELLACV